MASQHTPGQLNVPGKWPLALGKLKTKSNFPDVLWGLFSKPLPVDIRLTLIEGALAPIL